jgi:hypothetical protein
VLFDVRRKGFAKPSRTRSKKTKCDCDLVNRKMLHKYNFKYKYISVRVERANVACLYKSKSVFCRNIYICSRLS